jgi:sugar-specific transcriptional regulator TrmB
MSELSSNLIESLKTMGLTEYEAKVYSALVLFKRAKVKQIYEYLDVPKPSVYQSLKGLMNKGLVMIVNSKPAIYRAVPPKTALRHLTEIHRNAEESALGELEHLEKSSIETESDDVIWTLFGENNVEHSMEELILKAKKSMKLILPLEYMDYLSFISDKDLKVELLFFGEDIAIASRYGLKNLIVHDGYKIDLSDFGSLSKYLDRHALSFEEYSKFILVSVDDEEYMYVPSFPGKTKSGITSKNPYLISLVNVIFDAIWEHTPEMTLN